MAREDVSGDDRGLGRREFLRGGITLGAVGAGLSVAGCAGVGQGSAQQLTVAMSDAMVTTDPADHFSTATFSVLRHLYDPLIDNNNVSELVPALALSWTPVDDRTWRFKLREGIRFHDGSPFDADSVVYTLDRARTDRKLALWASFQGLASVRKEGDHQVVVSSRAPDAALPSRLNLLGMLPPSARGREEAFFQSPVGTGPYRFRRWVKGERVELDGITGYWRRGQPRVPHVVFLFQPDPEQRLGLLRRGQVDIMDRAAPQDVAALRQLRGVRIIETPSIEVQRWHFNLARAPWGDVRMRRAVSLAIDRDRIIRDIMLGFARPAISPIPPRILGHVEMPAKPHDPDRARALLREAGQPAPTLDWVLLKDRYARQNEIAAAVTEMLGQVGIRTSVRALPTEEALAQRRAGTYDLFYSLWSHTTHDPDWYLSIWYTKVGSAELSRFEDAKVEALVNEARSGDDQARARRYAEIARILWDQEYEIWPFYLQTLYGVRERIFNFVARRDGGIWLAPVGIGEG